MLYDSISTHSCELVNTGRRGSSGRACLGIVFLDLVGPLTYSSPPRCSTVSSHLFICAPFLFIFPSCLSVHLSVGRSVWLVSPAVTLFFCVCARASLRSGPRRSMAGWTDYYTRGGPKKKKKNPRELLFPLTHLLNPWPGCQSVIQFISSLHFFPRQRECEISAGNSVRLNFLHSAACESRHFLSTTPILESWDVRRKHR